ncbi:lytic murein transglycosylase [Polymorphum gilvum]|uniref:Lytic murein transglycosylase subfamily n=1 Tax=Polymorphum gilvum (strain LMG 25793 / CGMCC 1.9160 / SL003B-26A1) TaxID=991905 RepID=F2IVI3_POLGS|nr:lytic murein transglycosylase [Polymorphum gilvum]ADZ72701.1 Lytic murein transglycosylase subfamily [Polymorphum gilvum SL003B-26A1]
MRITGKGKAAMRRAILLLALAVSAPVQAGPYDSAFQEFLNRKVVPEAKRAGVSDAVLARELAGLTPATDLPGLGRPDRPEAPPEINFQAEFRPPAGYFSDSQFDALVAGGRRLLATHEKTLDAIERRYGVPRRIILAVWARESGYGAARIPHDAVRVLATRAFMGSQRRAFFFSELIDSLKILQTGEIPRARLKSSWGGAMGQPQFLPSSYLKYAVDFDGDGRRDIWDSPSDTMASIAHYLQRHGWVSGRDWGYEVIVPAGISCSREGPDRRQPFADFVREGIVRVREKPFPAHELPLPGNILMPAGRYGPAFLATENFYVLKAYNESDVYALFVGHLADRYGNNTGFVAPWRPVKHVSRGAVRDLQLRLERAGHDVGGADGLIGFKTRRSIGRAQEAAGLPATCWID